MDEMELRISNVFSNLPPDAPPEAIFIFNSNLIDKNFFYISGLHSGFFENCGILFDRKGEKYLFTTALEEEASRTIKSEVQFFVYRTEQERKQVLKRVLKNYSVIGLNFNRITHSYYIQLKKMLPGVKLFDVSSALRKTRMIKSEKEIEIIQKACKITSKVAEDIPSSLHQGITELELSAWIDYQMKRQGADGPAFNTIVAFGKSSSIPHYKSGNVQLNKGENVLVDFGAEYKGYCSDITRTYLTSEPHDDLLDLYKTVYEVQKMAIQNMEEGKVAREIDGMVRKYIDEKDRYRGRFIHNLGHSLGLEVHDDSYPEKEFEGRFKQGMVLTVEPGVYIPGLYGVRIEDDVLIQEKGCRVLTDASKEITIHTI